jgi:hypothetical protein
VMNATALRPLACSVSWPRVAKRAVRRHTSTTCSPHVSRRPPLVLTNELFNTLRIRVLKHQFTPTPVVACVVLTFNLTCLDLFEFHGFAPLHCGPFTPQPEAPWKPGARRACALKC